MMGELQGKYEVFYIYNLIISILYFLFLVFIVYKRSYTTFQLMFFTFFITLVFVLANNYVFQLLGNSYFMPRAKDPIAYHSLASNMMKMDFSEKLTFFSSFSISDLGFPLYLSYVYSIIHSPLFANICNVFVHLCTVLLLFKIGRFFLSRKYAFMGAFIYGISQYAVWFISSGLKETIMVFFVIASVFFYLKYVKKNTLFYLFLALISALFLILFRIPIVIFLVGAFAICELTKKKVGFKQYFAVIFVVLSVFLLSQFYSTLLLKYTTLSQFAQTEGGFQQFAYATAFIAGFFGPFPTYMPFDGKENLSLIAGSLTLYVFLTLPFLYACYYALKSNNIYMKPLVIYALFEITGLVYLAQSFDLRKGIPHILLAIMLAMYTLSNYRKFNKTIHKYIFGGFYITITGILFFWNYLRL